MPFLHSHTQLVPFFGIAKSRKPAHKPKLVKEYGYPNAQQTEKKQQIERKMIDMKKHQAVTCGHTQYGDYSVFQRLWLVSTFLHHDSEVASKSRTAHTAIHEFVH